MAGCEGKRRWCHHDNLKFAITKKNHKSTNLYKWFCVQTAKMFPKRNLYVVREIERCAEQPISQICHNDVKPWKRFTCYRSFVRGIHRSPVDSPYKGPVTRDLTFSLMLVQTNGLINGRLAGDLRRHDTHCNVIVMSVLLSGLVVPIANPR